MTESKPLTLINIFKVKKGRENEFIESWKHTASEIRQHPGNLDNNFHRSIDPNAEFQFVNVGHWRSVEDWKQMMETVKPAEKMADVVDAFEAHPSMYEVIFQN